MTDCTTFSSLFALVDSHLSNLSLQDSKSNEKVKSSISIPTINGDYGNASETCSSTIGQNLPSMPTVCVSESPISQILANQVNNMLLAKERRQREEQIIKQSKEEIKSKDEDIEIDLMQALQPLHKMTLQTKEEDISKSSFYESLFNIQFMDCDVQVTPVTKSAPLLPCITDMSYILKVKTVKKKCSTFGKVLTSRLRPVLGLYWHEKFNTKIKRFNFDTPSPCDIIKEKLRRPTVSATYTVSITDVLI